MFWSLGTVVFRSINHPASMFLIPPSIYILVNTNEKACEQKVIFVKFDIAESHEELSRHFGFHFCWTVLMTILCIRM
jgi:hypothetical protein